MHHDSSESDLAQDYDSLLNELRQSMGPDALDAIRASARNAVTGLLPRTEREQPEA